MTTGVPKSIRDRGIQRVVTNRAGRGVRLPRRDMFSLFDNELKQYVEAKYGKTDESETADGAETHGR